MVDAAEIRRAWGKYAPVLEPLLVLTGVYWVQFLVTRVGAATLPQLMAVKPIRGFPAYLFNGWDAVHYLRLAQNYDSYAWPPLYPMALHAVHGVLGSSFETAAVLVNLGSHVAVVLLAYAFLRGSPTLEGTPPWLFAALLLFFPGNNVFFAAYSESLFLALVLGACVAYQREKLWLAGLLCGVSLLTRNMGAFLGLAFIAAEVVRAIRERRFDAKRLAAVSLWIPFLVGWDGWLVEVAKTSPVEATNAWQQELIEKHVPAGANPRLWVLRFIALPGNKEWVYFWGSIAAMVWSWRKRLVPEAVFIGVFLLSFAVYLYRPFPFSRYVSTLFPLALMVAHATRRVPVLQAFTLAIAVVLSHHWEMLLFSDRMGEP